MQMFPWLIIREKELELKLGKVNEMAFKPTVISKCLLSCVNPIRDPGEQNDSVCPKTASSSYIHRSITDHKVTMAHEYFFIWSIRSN